MNIIRAGVVMLVYLFIVIIAYFAISPFMTAFFDVFDDADVGLAEDEMSNILPTIETVFSMFFSMLASIPITWFIMWTFSREPRWDYERY